MQALPDTVRTMTADVRNRTEAELAALIRGRPDLSIPMPADLTSLVARAATRASTQRALDGLDRGRLQVLHALAADDPVDLARAAGRLATTAETLRPVTEQLWSLALLWRGETGLHVPRSVAEPLRLATPPGGPAELDPPGLAATPVGAAAADAAAGGRAGQMLALVDEICLAWGEAPPRVLRSGGLAVRDLRAVQHALDLDPDQAGFVVELAYAAGLVGDDGDYESRFAPTPGYDVWSARDPAQRWAQLAATWLSSPRAACLVGSAGERGSINALARDALWPLSRQMRLDTLAELSSLPPGASADVESLVARVCWRRPLRRRAAVDLLVRATVREADWLGVTGAGALSAAGRALPDEEAAATAVLAMLPPPVEQVVLQADLTAVAPGRAEGGLARLLRLLTDIESRGAASVHRFTPASIRRGLDAGMAADDILRALRQASRTPLPQPLEYLVGDVARTHGLTRVGGVAAYLRSDDVAGLDAVLADRRLQPLRLRRIAPTVLVSPLDPSTVVQLLRRHGLAPVAEGEDGRVVLPARQGSRTPPRPSPPARTSRLDQQRLSELVARLREGEAARDRASAAEAAQPGPRLPSTDPAVTLSVLREAAADQTRVWLGHADREGEQSRVLFQPRRVIGGRAYGTVEGSEIERAFSVHRITGVLPA